MFKLVSRKPLLQIPPSCRWSQTIYRGRSITTNSVKLLPRKAKEISEEEVRNFYVKRQAAHENIQSRTSYDPFEYSIVPNENGIITPQDGIYEMLSQPALVIERQVEFMNLFLGFEQANKYKILTVNGESLGYMEEKDFGIFKMIGRQFFKLHRPFEIEVFNNYGELLMVIQRPFSFINSHIKSYIPGYNDLGHLELECLGESVQSWHLWRRRYNLFKLDDDVTNEYNQYGAIDAPFLSFEFPVTNDRGEVIGAVDRNWVGLGREFFTDTGVYVVRMDPASLQEVYGNAIAGNGLTLDQRAILLGNAISIDFDYFSRHSRGGGGFFRFGDYE